MKTLKVRVLAHKDGKIIAVESVSLKPEHIRYKADDHFTALAGQAIHEVDVPEEIAHHDIHALHRELFNYQVETGKEAPRLIREPAS